ncbi:MAG: hypothetical protein JST43_06720 [Bacteroidetes bacterium]|nr:hypothetical protein [Bacteroidota bacterium]MBS1539616.1 hypothetical protein [Bacteroidota bacterium]
MKTQQKTRWLLISLSATAITLLGSLGSCHTEVTYKNGAPGQLPPITQTGANTFGCLVNGKVWKPEGEPMDNVLDLSFDPIFNGGTLSLKAARYTDSANLVIKEFIDLSMSQLNKSGSYYLDTIARNAQGAYTLGKESTTGVTISYCEFGRPKQDSRIGNLTITRFDPSNNIISGTFYFTIIRPHDTTYSCSTKVVITDGRFDMKIQ